MKHHNPVEIIRKKREGSVLSDDEISYFIVEYMNGKITDYQAAALLMSIYFKGLNSDEIMSLTKSIINSGEIIDLSHIKKPKIDKHSTGGVGDKTSIILAPLLACFDIVVPMMSGRGLGHTGGTLDKLESIPGFKVNLSVNEFKSILSKINVSMIGQTQSLTPADKKIYELRDVTATVENVGLITASIISKKIAEGTDGIVFDVKVGSGSTLPTYEKSMELAQNLISVSKKFGKKAIALLTDMSEPLGYSIGNWLEIEECVSIMKSLSNRNYLSEDLCEVTLHLAGAMLKLGGKCDTIQEGVYSAKNKLENGECFRKFLELVELQGGDCEYIVNKTKFPSAKYSENIYADKDGYIA
ncbi:MAG: thymidine phosphorylase, partial [Ignavibacteria bacterium]